MGIKLLIGIGLLVYNESNMKNTFQKGLTLLELMAVVAMIIIVTGIVFASYGIGKDSMALERAGQKLYQDFRLTINAAMAGSTEYKGVGIYFNNSTEANSKVYIIYKDLNTSNNRIYDSGEELYTINIEDGVKICDIRNVSDTSVTTSTIFFKSPYPTTFLNPSSGDETQGIYRTPNSIKIELCMIDDENRTKTININSSGRVNIE